MILLLASSLPSYAISKLRYLEDPHRLRPNERL